MMARSVLAAILLLLALSVTAGAQAPEGSAALTEESLSWLSSWFRTDRFPAALGHAHLRRPSALFRPPRPRGP